MPGTFRKNENLSVKETKISAWFLSAVLIALATAGCSTRLSDAQVEAIRTRIEINFNEFQSPPSNPSYEELQSYREEYKLRMVVSMIEVFSQSEGLDENQVNALINRVITEDTTQSYLALQKVFDNQTMIRMLQKLKVIQDAASYEADRIQFFPAIPRIEGITDTDPNRIIGEPDPIYSHYLQMRQSSVGGDLEPRFIPIPPKITQDVLSSTFFEDRSLISLVRDEEGRMYYTLIIPYGFLDDQDQVQASGFLVLELNELNILRSNHEWIEVPSLNALQKAGITVTEFLHDVFSSMPKEVVVNRSGEYPESSLLSITQLSDDLRKFGGITTWSLLGPVEYQPETTRNTAPGHNRELLLWFSQLGDEPIDYREVLSPTQEELTPITRFVLVSSSSRVNNPKNLTVLEQENDTSISVGHQEVIPVGKSAQKHNLQYFVHQGIEWLVLSVEVTKQQPRTDYLPASTTYEVFAIPTRILVANQNKPQSAETISEALERLWGNTNFSEMEVFPY